MKTNAHPHPLAVGPFWLALSTLLLAIAPAVAANWPAWRGPEGSGVSPEKNIPTRWSSTENVRWKIPLPDRGNSTPAVWGDKVFVT